MAIMNIKTIRAKNLESLIAESESVKACAAKIGVDPSYISQIRSGLKNIGHQVARRCEKAWGKPEGWMDANHDTAADDRFEIQQDRKTYIQASTEMMSVPVISSVQAGSWCEASDPFLPGDADEWVPCPTKHSARTYALKVKGVSMEPEFFQGQIIIVDPEVSPDSGRFVIAKKSSENEVTLKQLIREGGVNYLKALNPDWPERIIKLDEDWHVCGVVISSVKNYL